MKSPINIKSFRNGLNIILDPDIPFEELYVAYAEKFRDSAKFFGQSKLVISFEGRKLEMLEERALVEAIEEYTDITVLCVLDRNEENDLVYLKAADAFSASGECTDASVYKGTVHAGQNVETKGSIIILGDVNVGAVINSYGSIVVLGTLYGEANAGITSNPNAFICATDIKASLVTVNGHECKSFIKSAGFLRQKPGAQIVYCVDDEIQVSELNRDFLAKLPF